MSPFDVTEQWKADWEAVANSKKGLCLWQIYKRCDC